MFGAVSAIVYGQVTPKFVDNSGNTKFHCIFISGAPEYDAETLEIHNLWNQFPMKAGSSSTMVRDGDIKSELKNWLDAKRNVVEPNEEVCIYYNGHGGDGKKAGAKDKDKDDPDEYDNHITSTKKKGGKTEPVKSITDDELATMISGFKESVTFVIILDSCYGGTFSDGTKDLPSAKNKEGAVYGDHLSHIGPSGTIRNEMTEGLKKALEKVDGRARGDTDKDGKLTGEELKKFLEDENALTTTGVGPTKCVQPATIDGIEVDFFPNSEAEVTIDTPVGSDTVKLEGPTTVEVDLTSLGDVSDKCPSAGDPDVPNGLEEVQTEIRYIGTDRHQRPIGPRHRQAPRLRQPPLPALNRADRGEHQPRRNPRYSSLHSASRPARYGV